MNNTELLEISLNEAKTSKVIVGIQNYRFLGILNWQKLINIIKNLYEAFDINVYEQKLQRKAFHVYAELLQNAYKHGVENDEVEFVVKVERKNIKFITVNYSRIDDSQNLSRKMNYLEMMNEVELKKLNREVLTTGTPCINGKSHTLGLIWLHRKSRNKVNYKIENIDAEKSKVTVEVILSTV